MSREIKIGNVYRHFKNKYYVVIDIVNDCESNNDDVYKKIVIYRALYGEFITWARPYDMFNSEVDHEKYPYVTQKYRFEEVDVDCYMIRQAVESHNMIMAAEITNLKYELLRRDIQCKYTEIMMERSELPLDELLHLIYKNVNFDGMSFSKSRLLILSTLNIDELAYYTKDVNPDLIEYVEQNVFPQYAANDKAHGIVHIKEVIRRSFALNETFSLGLEPNIVYTIAAYHDLGKHENHEIHERIAASKFLADQQMVEWFTDDERKTIAEAIEDHRSSKSKDSPPRSVYGDLISSADRNTSIDMVFIRSFFVAQERMPDFVIEDYLNYTIERLSKRYSQHDPENMFLEDETYRVFLKDMRELLKKPSLFRDRYCEINNIDNRKVLVKDCPGYE